MDLNPALSLGRLHGLPGGGAAGPVGELVLPHGNSAVAQELVIDSAAAVLLLCAEKELALLAEVKDVAGVAEGGVDVVGDHDDRDARLLIDAGDLGVEAPRRDRVQAGDRLVEQDQFLGGTHGAGQKDALLLAAGQVPVALVLQVQDLQGFHILPGARFFRAGVEGPQAHAVEAAGQDDFPHAGGEVLLDLGLLGQVADLSRLQALSHLHRAGGRLFQAQEALDQRALAGAVLTDDAEIVSLLHGEIQIVDDCHAIVGEGQVFTFEQTHGSPSGLPEKPFGTVLSGSFCCPGRFSFFPIYHSEQSSFFYTG